MPKPFKENFLKRIADKMAEAGTKPATVNRNGKTVLKNTKELKNNKKYYEKCLLNSQILGDGVYLSMDTRFTQRNCNSIVFGGPGTGKTRHYIKPNILNMNSSFVVVDPDGELYQDLSAGLEKSGYHIKLFNLSEEGSSMKYNPLYYVHTTVDIEQLVDTIILNINKFNRSVDNQMMGTLICAIIGYMYETYPVKQRTFANMITLLKKADFYHESELDKLMEALNEKKQGGSYAAQKYKTFKMVTKETANNTLDNVLKCLNVFSSNEFANLTCCDEMELDKIGKEKAALFLIIPKYTKTTNFLLPVLCWQLFEILIRTGEYRMREEKRLDPKLKVHTTFILDEISNIGIIPNIDCYFATCCKYNIGITCIFDSPSQQINGLGCKNITNNIINCCDTIVHLGGSSETVQFGEHIIQGNKILTMDHNKLVAYVRGNKPQIVDKFPLQYHPNYYLTSEYDPSLKRTLNDMP